MLQKEVRAAETGVELLYTERTPSESTVASSEDLLTEDVEDGWSGFAFDPEIRLIQMEQRVWEIQGREPAPQYRDLAAAEPADTGMENRAESLCRESFRTGKIFSSWMRLVSHERRSPQQA